MHIGPRLPSMPFLLLRCDSAPEARKWIVRSSRRCALEIPLALPRPVYSTTRGGGEHQPRCCDWLVIRAVMPLIKARKNLESRVSTLQPVDSGSYPTTSGLSALRHLAEAAPSLLAHLAMFSVAYWLFPLTYIASSSLSFSVGLIFPFKTG